MDRKMHTQTYRLETSWESTIEAVLPLMNKDRARNLVEYLYNIKGEYVVITGSPTPENDQHRVKLVLKTALPSFGNKKIYYLDIPIASAEYLIWIEKNPSEDVISAMQYRNNAVLVKFLKNHYQVQYSEGEFKNTNVNPKNLTFKLTNLSGNLKSSYKSRVEKNFALNQLAVWAETNEKTLIHFCYLSGLKQIESLTKEELFIAISEEIEKNYLKFYKIEKWLKDTMKIAISKGLLTKLKGEENEVIYKNGNFFMFNQDTLGETEEEVYSYFETHPQNYTILKKILGIEEEIEVELKEKAAIVSTDTNPKPKSVTRNIDSAKTTIENRLKQIKNNKNVVLDKNDKGHFQEIGGEYTKLKVFTDFMQSEVVVLNSLQEFTKEKAEELKVLD